MGEQKLLPLSLDHEMTKQAFGRVAWLLQQVVKGATIEALPKYGRYLQRRLVRWIEPIEARLNEALDGPGHGKVGTLNRIAQEVFEEEGVAGGSLNASFRQLRVRANEGCGE